MNIRGSIDGYARQKKCIKITFVVKEEDCMGVASQLDLFVKKPITLQILTDRERQAEELTRISPDQRAKIFALIKDIAAYTGEGKENQREILTDLFCDEMQFEKFSLSDCSEDTAGAFIEWLVGFAFELGVPMSENPITGLKDIESYIHTCIKHKRCVCCSKDAELVKWEGDTVIPLCQVHKAKVMKMGRAKFTEEYHVMGVRSN